MRYPGQPTAGSGGRPQSRLAATDNTPWMSVSLLAEHTFCHRAAVIQHESNDADTGEDPPLLKGRRRRVYLTLGQLRRALKRRRNVFAATMLATAASGAAYSTTSNPWWGLLFYAGVLASGITLFRWFGFWLTEWLPASRTSAKIPAADHTESAAVKWWSYIRAGYEPQRSEEGLRDTHWRLAGSPWRVLVHGDIRIPVFRARASKDGNNRLYKKHWVRMVAYCQLIERCEGATSPYGIVLFGDSLKGYSLPVSPGSRKTFHDALVATRATVERLSMNRLTGPGHYGVSFSPPNDYATRCEKCPHSWRDRETGQSVCGQRFAWTPPNFRDYRYYR